MDLYEEKNVPKVINFLVLLDGQLKKLNLPNFPSIEPLDVNATEGFTDEQMKKAEEQIAIAEASSAPISHAEKEKQLLELQQEMVNIIIFFVKSINQSHTV